MVIQQTAISAMAAAEAWRRRSAPVLRVAAVVLVLLFAVGRAAAQEYYVNPASGADGNNGTSASTAFKTLAHAASVSGTGDTIAIASGGVCRETNVTITHATVQASGSGAMPVVTAGQQITSWTPWSSNTAVLTASVSSQVLAVYCQGARQTLARYPNSNATQPFLHDATGSTVGQIVDPTLAGDGGKWAGAQLRWRRWSWWWETRQITADDGNGDLSLSGASTIQYPTLVGIGAGYFIENSLAALDAPGEWYWNSATSTLYFYPPAGSNPAGGDVEVVTTTGGITSNGANITGIAFREFAGTALAVDSPATVSACSFSDMEGQPLEVAYYTGGTQITGCSFRDCNGSVVVNQDATETGTAVTGNTFERIGTNWGYGGGSAIWVSTGSQVTVSRNRIADVGGPGIDFNTNANGNIASSNILIRCMSILNDGAAMATDCGGSVISNNLIVNAIGDLTTSMPWTPLGHGIWTDAVDAPNGALGWSGQTITDNTIIGSGGFGLFLNHNDQDTISGNIVYGNELASVELQNNGDATDLTQQDTIDGNVLVGTSEARYPQQANPDLASWAATPLSDLLQFDDSIDGNQVNFGGMAGNALVWPSSAVFAQAVASTSSSSSTTNLMSVSSWQQGRSWTDPAPTVWNRDGIVLFNDTTLPAAVPVPSGSWVALNGAPVGVTVNLAPFTGAVVLAAAGVSAAAVPAVTLASGTVPAQANPFGLGASSTSLVTQAINFPALGTLPYPSSAVALSAWATSGLPPTFMVVSGPATLSGSNLTLTGLGTVVLSASQAGNGIYAAAPTVSQSVTVGAAPPAASSSSRSCGLGSLFGALLLAVGVRRRRTR